MMPELPEVETIVRGLSAVRGARIDALQVLDPRLEIPADEISGATIEEVRRRGRYIVFHLSGGRLLIVHLRMSGRLTLTRSPAEEKHTRLILHLDRGKVYFINPRRLGTVDPRRAADTLTEEEIKALHPVIVQVLHAAIERIVQAGRSTFLCPGCQR